MRAGDDMRPRRKRRFRHRRARPVPLVSRLPGRLSCMQVAPRPSAPRTDRADAAARSMSTGKFAEVETGDRVALAGDQRHRLAAEAHEAFGQRRLVGERRDGAETVLAGDVGRGEDRRRCRDSPRTKAPRSPKAKARAMMRRAHDQHRTARRRESRRRRISPRPSLSARRRAGPAMRRPRLPAAGSRWSRSAVVPPTPPSPPR